MYLIEHAISFCSVPVWGRVSEPWENLQCVTVTLEFITDLMHNVSELVFLRVFFLLLPHTAAVPLHAGCVKSQNTDQLLYISNTHSVCSILFCWIFVQLTEFRAHILNAGNALNTTSRSSGREKIPSPHTEVWGVGDEGVRKGFIRPA